MDLGGGGVLQSWMRKQVQRRPGKERTRKRWATMGMATMHESLTVLNSRSSPSRNDRAMLFRVGIPLCPQGYRACDPRWVGAQPPRKTHGAVTVCKAVLTPTEVS